jgi:hypothetical protein
MLSMDADKSTSYVVLPPTQGMGAVDLGIDAGVVESIIAESEWHGEPPVDVAVRLGVVRWTESTPRRVIKIKAQEKALLVSGRLSVRNVDRRLVQPLPEAVLSSDAARMLDGIVFSEGESPLLVISTAGLAS